MSNLKLRKASVLFPEKEKAFVVNADKNAPFTTAIIGVTYPDPAYRVERGAIKTLTVFEYVKSGEGEISIGGERVKVKAGDTYVLMPTEAHSYRASSDDPWKKYWINYISDYMGAYLAAYGIKTGVYKIASEPLFEKLNALCKRSEISDEDVYSISETVHAIVALIAKSGADTDTADKIRALLCSAVYGKISLESIAHELHISRSGVIRTFKKKFGISPYEYLLSSKIEVAKTLLRTTRLTVKQIAEKLEILDEHYFSTLFAKRTGVRPLEYRKLPKDQEI